MLRNPSEVKIVRQLEGRVAVVTGAGRGIGRAAAAALAKEGADVALVARSSPQLAEAAGDVGAVGGCALEIRADVGAPGVAALVCRRVVSELGPVDILVNNAAVVWPLEPTWRLDPEDWIASLQINLVGVFRLTRAVLPEMVERGWGRIVNVSSGVVDFPGDMVGANAYVTSKAALEGHTLNLAAELAGTGVTANVLRPGMVNTAMQAWIREQPTERVGTALHDWFVQMQESGMLLEPAEPARMIAELVASQANGEVVDARRQR
jgi:NAD(P)-dependent dehydrogenase (short-subunit alcohol dehydrogenase family)